MFIFCIFFAWLILSQDNSYQPYELEENLLFNATMEDGETHYYSFLPLPNRFIRIVINADFNPYWDVNDYEFTVYMDCTTQEDGDLFVASEDNFGCEFDYITSSTFCYNYPNFETYGTEIAKNDTSWTIDVSLECFGILLTCSPVSYTIRVVSIDPSLYVGPSFWDSILTTLYVFSAVMSIGISVHAVFCFMSCILINYCDLDPRITCLFHGGFLMFWCLFLFGYTSYTFFENFFENFSI